MAFTDLVEMLVAFESNPRAHTKSELITAAEKSGITGLSMRASVPKLLADITKALDLKVEPDPEAESAEASDSAVVSPLSDSPESDTPIAEAESEASPAPEAPLAFTGYKPRWALGNGAFILGKAQDIEDAWISKTDTKSSFMLIFRGPSAARLAKRHGVGSVRSVTEISPVHFELEFAQHALANQALGSAKSLLVHIKDSETIVDLAAKASTARKALASPGVLAGIAGIGAVLNGKVVIFENAKGEILIHVTEG